MLVYDDEHLDGDVDGVDLDGDVDDVDFDGDTNSVDCAIVGDCSDSLSVHIMLEAIGHGSCSRLGGG